MSDLVEDAKQKASDRENKLRDDFLEKLIDVEKVNQTLIKLTTIFCHE